MAYRIRYTWNIDWVGPGAGPMESLNPGSGNLPGGGASGQTLGGAANFKAAGLLLNGTGTSGALAAADVTNLTNSMAADVAAQLNAQIAIPQGWVSGNP
jgi:hypothetical protein